MTIPKNPKVKTTEITKQKALELLADIALVELLKLHQTNNANFFNDCLQDEPEFCKESLRLGIPSTRDMGVGRP